MAGRVRAIPKNKRNLTPMRAPIKAPTRLGIIETSLACPVINESLLSDLSPQTLDGLKAISSQAPYPRGTILFTQGQDPQGVFVIRKGRLGLSATGAHGKSLVVRIAQEGEIIGLPSSISRSPYEVTAEAVEPIQINFMHRELFLRFLREHGDAAVRVAETLCHIYHLAYQEVKRLSLYNSVSEKLARFILELTNSEGNEGGIARATVDWTHEEIAETIGSSRETVTRLFAKFKKQQLIEVHGSTLVVKDRAGLVALVANSG